ncbi:MAG: alpha-ketoacid dehydrogenase subunit beta [Dehalococcoidales bacterium]|nr:alpha-ketoacid dehydrogenase subunit beta [Dehalococcoidales bacterium]
MDWRKTLFEEDPDLHKIDNETSDRQISYVQAVREALEMSLKQDSSVYIMGQGVDDPDGMFGITRDLHKEYGSNRVFDTPLSEDALTGIAVGSAITGMRPVYMHNRPDFLLLAMDHIVNHASKWSYMFGGKVHVPLVLWAAVGRGWGGAAQHTQNLHGLFENVPGLKLVMPSTPYDAKGLMLTAIADNNPVLIIEHRWLLRQTSNVPEGEYFIPFGKGVIRREGTDVTIVAISQMVVEVMAAARELEEEGISVEVIDPRTLKPLDEDIILDSVKKTGKLIVADTGWKTGGVSAEITAMVAEKGFNYLKAPVKRLALPDVPTPASYVLEAEYYPDKNDVIEYVRNILK